MHHWDPVTPQRDITDTPKHYSSGLFVSEDNNGEAFAVQSSITFNRPNDITNELPGNDMDGLSRARTIKAIIKNNVAILKPQDAAAKRLPESDPEDQIIKDLRDNQTMPWGEIADFLNQERRNRDEAATFTASSVYSRYVCTAPRIATSVGEIGFDPRDYRHLRNPNQYTSIEGTGMTSKAGKKRVKNYENAKELEVNMRKKIEATAELETSEKTEQLMQAVAKVERNFWQLVADEMERATTRYYPSKALADRYHAI